VEVIDLNRVLDIFDATLKSQSAGDADATEATPESGGAGDSGATDAGGADTAGAVGATDGSATDGSATGVTGTDEAAGPPVDLEAPEQPEVTAAFLKAFAANLNAANLIRSVIGVELGQTGAIVGFADGDGNGMRAMQERELFRIEYDADGNRVIATQQVSGNTYRRDHYYHHGYHSYYYYGALHRSMWGRQRDYYGAPGAMSGRSRPDYSRMQMSPTNYHSGAVSRATASMRSSRSSSGSARGFGGSRSFSSGK
jgi:hypothetical protein